MGKKVHDRVWRLIFAAPDDHHDFLYRSTYKSRLTPLQRQAVRLRYDKGVTTAHLAEQLGLTAHELRMVVQGATRKLRKYLTKHPGGNRLLPLLAEEVDEDPALDRKIDEERELLIQRGEYGQER